MIRNRIVSRVAPLFVFVTFITGCTVPPAGVGTGALGGPSAQAPIQQPTPAASASPVSRNVMANLSPRQTSSPTPESRVTPRAKPSGATAPAAPAEPYVPAPIDYSLQVDLDGDGRPDSPDDQPPGLLEGVPLQSSEEPGFLSYREVQPAEPAPWYQRAFEVARNVASQPASAPQPAADPASLMIMYPFTGVSH